ncbi:nicotinate-nucleotide adenylyltransferase [Novosphingobium mangrovi (ex Huang et al. 2023)]|uniref:Probable nicotinate-nucleotide adenylyltransferase n=1 Tax=Novosphingobium mangrovi (ex Huang et al. 2023) TaxID=2976432 RepID=A0ABT2I8Y4_9SPHN|nr:nicotinate-nucleotide adenylyltransferase [Novosphingobium mangrovi (ex Huang et al. 2023)]MCT2401241.1 nicotinate-nucleotide adenylyltransferase [Novosphingobium mangrovi (ex Huang et al. 2023)]
MATQRRGGPVTGLLGGSFNPAHGGHRRISLFAMEALGLDEVWWLVSPGNPLKSSAGMAPLATRVESARAQARCARIRVTAIERELGTRYTVDTLRALLRRYPKRRFVWLMGADNLAQFHKWKDWRAMAKLMPIAVVARPGYDAPAFASPAMAWLRRFRKPRSSLRGPERWSAPALVTLRFDPDTRSATAIRQTDPDWARTSGTRNARTQHSRDAVTHRLIPGTAA